MAGVWFTEMQSRPMAFLDFTSVTLDEFQQLIPPFEAAFQVRMAMWCMDGKPRTARRFTVYKNCPLPTPEDRLFFVLTYLKTSTLQVVHGRLIGMVQGKANQWLHLLLPALLAALRALADAPTRSLTALAQRLGVSEGDAMTVVTPVGEDPGPGDALPTAAPASPLSPMTAPNDVSSAPKRGRQHLFNAAIHTLRLCVERTFAWEDKFKRVLLRFERIQQRHYGMKLMAYTMINLRAFCGV